MCGIAAIFGTSTIHFEWIKQMTDIIHHRGPDDEGYVIFPNNQHPVICGGLQSSYAQEKRYPYTPLKSFHETLGTQGFAALGHRRLSIIDLTSAGHQPMCCSKQQLWITYNGEIYNYLEIRQELEKLGVEFVSHSDTEVILKAYQQWGRACLSRFNGMFAFVIYDNKSRHVFAARDRFGVKPLYYWHSPQGFIAFASEIKQFTSLPGWKATINGQGGYDFLNWGMTDHTDQTMFAGVDQLRGGECLDYDLSSGNAKISRWYDLQPQLFTGSFTDASEQFAYLLEDAVRLRLRSDVDVGSCLSGGLDSSSIVCLANTLLRKNNASHKQKTFSACSEIKRVDERFFIDIVKDHTQVDSYYTYPSLDKLFEETDSIAWHQDEPYGSTSIYAQWKVFQLVKELGVKVMLDGQGADEQLAGYHPFFGGRFYELFSSFRWKHLRHEMKMTQELHGINHSLRHLFNLALPNAIRQPLRRMLKKPASRPHWLDFSVLRAKDQDPFLGIQRKTVQQQSYLQIQHSSLPMLLRYEDRDSMAHSVESRTPFLDYRLVEFNLGLPSEFKISQGITKRVLREGMKGTLPEQIRMRIDKIGFATAEEEWVKQQNPQIFRNAIKEAIDCSQGILKPSLYPKMEQMIAGKEPFNFFLWRIISFGNWIKKFSVSI